MSDDSVFEVGKRYRHINCPDDLSYTVHFVFPSGAAAATVHPAHRCEYETILLARNRPGMEEVPEPWEKGHIYRADHDIHGDTHVAHVFDDGSAVVWWLGIVTKQKFGSVWKATARSVYVDTGRRDD